MQLDEQLRDHLAAFLAANGAQSTLELRELLKAIRARSADNPQAAWQALRCAVLPTITYSQAQSILKLFGALTTQIPSTQERVRIAVLGSFTTSQLIPLLKLQLFASGIASDFYEAEYGTFRQEILDPSSGLYEFRPQVVFLATATGDVSHRPSPPCRREEASAAVTAEYNDWAELWSQLYDRLGCQIIQNNFVSPAWRVFGNHELRQPGSLGNLICELNRTFAEQAPPYVVVHDADHLAASAGRWNWSEPRFVHQAKLPCAPDYLVDYAHSLASLIAALRGKARKCLVLDLDNTLWGGVIGDDSLDGIRIGHGTPEGEAFLAFQHYAKSLMQRGVLLAVCSKNQPEAAREPFLKHSEMALRLSDIACFVANWEDKAANVRAIAEQLNIGLDSLVLVDDNPAEREIVRRLVPEVAVPELPADIADYPRAVEQHRYFQVLSVGGEDFRRTQFYQADVLRREVQSSARDVNDYLRSLQMTARIQPLDVNTLERSAQLIGRSNQFNLTTRRRSSADLLPLMTDPNWLIRTITLADRFGDHGLISVILPRRNGRDLKIDTWVMSCRVLKRGVERLVLNELVALARELKLQSIVGEYLATDKNALVRDHYAGLGFSPLGVVQPERSLWSIPIGADYRPAEHFIQELTSDERFAS